MRWLIFWNVVLTTAIGALVVKIWLMDRLIALMAELLLKIVAVLTA